MKLPSVDKMCNIAGCALIAILLLLLIVKPEGLRSIMEGNSPLSNPQVEGNVNKSNNNNNGNNNGNNAGKAVTSSLGLGKNEQFAAVSGISTPTRSCYPQDSLSPKELL